MPYWLALAVTVALEVPVYTAVLVPRPRWWRAVAAVVAVNLATHPFVWWALDGAHGARYWLTFAAVESGAVAVEAALLRRWWPRPARRLAVPAAVLANAVSCLAGLLVALARR